MTTTNWREDFSFFKIFTLMMVVLVLTVYFPKVGTSEITALTIANLRNSEIVQRNTTETNHLPVITPYIKTQLTCLARAIYYEAGGETFSGKLAVAQVVINREHSGKFRNSLCKVIYQKTEFQNNTVCQFSWVCNPEPPIIPRFAWSNSMWIAKLAYLEHKQLSDLTHALYFHTVDSTPGWHLRRVAQIDHLVFYSPD
jgi:spore germination cell wall hydrolase CwlJ-like protein